MLARTTKIELRKITHNQRLSEETECFSADLYVDGRKVAEVSNRGNGGCDEVHPVAGFDLRALDAHIAATHPPLDMSKYGMDSSPATLEVVCGRLLADHLTAQDLKRLLSAKVLLADADGTVHEVRFKGVKIASMDAATRERAFKVAAEMQPGATVLNALPFDKALALYRKTPTTTS